MSDREELIRLRIGVARIAQAAGVSLLNLGLADDASYEQIRHAADTRERGWNWIAGLIVEELRIQGLGPAPRPL